MKKAKLIGLTALLLSFGATGCFGTNPGGDPGTETEPAGYVGTNENHYKVDSKGNRIGEPEPHTLVDSEGDAKHQPVAATCTKIGKGYKKCTICEKFVEYTIPQLQHNYAPSTDPDKAATCTRAGLEVCTLCNATRETGKALGHNWTADGDVAGAGANDAAVKKNKCTRCNAASYVIDIQTAKLSLGASSSWKTNPSTGAFKLDGNDQSCSFTFNLPAGITGKMYERAYMDQYSANKDKKAFFETDSVCNIEVKVNNAVVDMSSQSTTKFSDLFGDELNGTDSTVKDVLLGSVTLGTANTVTYKRIKTLNMIVSAFVFVEDK